MLRRIEEIVPGDKVLAKNMDMNLVAFSFVTQTFQNQTTSLIHITLPNDEVTVTEIHPFFTQESGWLDAKDLTLEHHLVDADGNAVPILGLGKELLEESIPVYNLEVEETHTYFVSKDGILVHNKCKNNPLYEDFDEMFEDYSAKNIADDEILGIAEYTNLPSAEEYLKNPDYSKFVNSGITHDEFVNSIGKDFEDLLTKALGGEGSIQLGGRDFDGGTGTGRLWEAKSGKYWEDVYKKNPSKFYSDMGDRLRIATENNSTYELFSNTPIPREAKRWLDKHGIPYTELF